MGNLLAVWIPLAGLPRLLPGFPSWCHGFCHRDKFVKKSTLLHRSMPAKTHATVRQLAEQHAHTTGPLANIPTEFNIQMLN
jgi:hypothetical protein